MKICKVRHLLASISSDDTVLLNSNETQHVSLGFAINSHKSINDIDIDDLYDPPDRKITTMRTTTIMNKTIHRKKGGRQNRGPCKRRSTVL